MSQYIVQCAYCEFEGEITAVKKLQDKNRMIMTKRKQYKEEGNFLSLYCLGCGANQWRIKWETD